MVKYITDINNRVYHKPCPLTTHRHLQRITVVKDGKTQWC